MKKYLIFVLSSILLFSCKQNKSATATISDVEFEKTVQHIIDCFNQKDTAGLNELIHPEIGIYFLYSIGSVPRWTNQKEFFLDTIYRTETELPYWDRETLAFCQIETDFPIKRIKDIDVTDKNNEKGIFLVDNPDFQKRLSFNATVETENEVFDEQLKQKKLSEIEKIKNFEQNTRYIVASFKDSWDYFCFYVTKIDEKWYLTMIDFFWYP